MSGQGRASNPSWDADDSPTSAFVYRPDDAYWVPTGPHRPSGPGVAGVGGRSDLTLPPPVTRVSAPSTVGDVGASALTTAAPGARRTPGTATLVTMAAVVALVVGGAAGWGAGVASRNLTGTPSPVPSVGAANPTAANPTAANPTAAGTPRATIPVAPPTANTVAIAERLLPSTVTLKIRDGSRGSTGSGFVINADRGYIMTNNHVVASGAQGGSIAAEFNDGSTARGKIVGRSPSYDIAVIQVETDLTLRAVEIGNAEATRVGQTVIAFGAPLGLGGTVTQGIISAKDRPVAVGSGSTDADANVAYIDALQTDAPINPGNSGGPLVDAGGRVIGVNSAILTLGAERGSSGNIGLGFAIPINQAMQIGAELIDRGVATYPILGAEVADTRTDPGVRLQTVSSGGPAAKAGLRSDDVIVSIDGRPVSAAVELIVAIRTHRPGDTVRLGYARDGRQLEARVTLGSKEG